MAQFSFDIESTYDKAEMNNVEQLVTREIANRYDFKGTHTVIELDKKAFTLKVETENDMQMQQLEDVLVTRSMRQGLEATCYDLSEEPSMSGKHVKKTIKIKNGISKEDGKKIVKANKDSNLKVQAAIMDDIIRVTAKKIDDLQAVIHLCRNSNFELPLQYINMKS